MVSRHTESLEELEAVCPQWPFDDIDLLFCSHRGHAHLLVESVHCRYHTIMATHGTFSLCSNRCLHCSRRDQSLLVYKNGSRMSTNPEQERAEETRLI
jgi:hypothetical protein